MAVQVIRTIAQIYLLTYLLKIATIVVTALRQKEEIVRRQNEEKPWNEEVIRSNFTSDLSATDGPLDDQDQIEPTSSRQNEASTCYSSLNDATTTTEHGTAEQTPLMY